MAAIKPSPELNVELIKLVVKQIDAETNRWYQGCWYLENEPCGTIFCFAGWSLQLEGRIALGPNDRMLPLARDGQLSTRGFSDEARELLGLSQTQADILFYTMHFNWAEYKRLITVVTGVSFDE